jgi:hypothetical protein
VHDFQQVIGARFFSTPGKALISHASGALRRAFSTQISTETVNSLQPEHPARLPLSLVEGGDWV